MLSIEVLRNNLPCTYIVQHKTTQWKGLKSIFCQLKNCQESNLFRSLENKQLSMNPNVMIEDIPVNLTLFSVLFFSHNFYQMAPSCL